MQKPTVLGVKLERDEREAVTAVLRQDDESDGLERLRKVIRRSRQVVHDVSVSALAETNELIVLSDDLTCSAREVECE